MKHSFGLRLMLLVCVACSSAGAIYAQDYQYRGEIYDNAGLNGMNDDETNLGKG